MLSSATQHAMPPESGRSFFLNLEVCFSVLEFQPDTPTRSGYKRSRQTTQYVMPPEFNGKWGTECLDT